MQLGIENVPNPILDSIAVTDAADAFHREHLDDVADLEVVELVEADAALEAGLDLARRRP